MNELKGKVAVITGGASGIGKALAEAFAAEGTKLVLADVEAPALDTTVAELTDAGHTAIGVVTDVTDLDSVRHLADEAYAAFGAVNILCNNAGVGPPSAKVWETTPNDWRWTFGVNVFGVVNGIIEFVPRMLASGEEGIVINTSSPDGPIAPMPMASVYAATKSALTTITECLAAQLDADGANVKAAVFYPSGRGLLDTGLWTSDRNRPKALERERPRTTPAMTVADLREKGMPVQPLDELARMVVDGIRADRFMLILDPESRTETTLRTRLEKIVAGREPDRGPPTGLTEVCAAEGENGRTIFCERTHIPDLGDGRDDHLRLALDNGLTQDEIVEAITHLAFYTGWPSAFTAINLAKSVFPATN